MVDDNVDVGIFAARYLKEAGFRVRVVRSGEEALRAMADGASGVRVVLADKEMHGMSGLELARELALRHPTAGVVFMAGCPWEGDTPLPGPLILKPFDGTQVVGTVRQMHDSPRP